MRDVANIPSFLVYFAGDHDQCMKYKKTSSVGPLHKLIHFCGPNCQLIHCFIGDDLRISKLTTAVNHFGWSHEWLTSALGRFK